MALIEVVPIRDRALEEAKNMGAGSDLRHSTLFFERVEKCPIVLI